MKRRSPFEIEIAILETTRHPILVSHIMCKTGSNLVITKQITNKLLTKGFIVTTECPIKPHQKSKNTNSKRTYYAITPKGEQILKTALALLKEMA